MKAGIIAAGKGSRLAQGGILTPKPLVRVGGQTLVERALHEAAAAGAERAALITTPAFPEVAAYLRGRAWPLPLDLMVWDSPNSLESFLALAPCLDCPFLLLTVDAIFAPRALGRFVSRAQAAPPLGALGVTTFKEDESPLYVHLDPEGRVLAVGQPEPSPYITAGCYYFQPEVFQWQNRARALGLAALRQFLALLAREGYPLIGLDVGPAVDVDHPGDLARAEELLRTGRLPCPR
jgi:NDP-sugar pyrophosphorylase family protein